MLGYATTGRVLDGFSNVMLGFAATGGLPMASSSTVVICETRADLEIVRGGLEAQAPQEESGVGMRPSGWGEAVDERLSNENKGGRAKDAQEFFAILPMERKSFNRMATRDLDWVLLKCPRNQRIHR